MSTIRETIDKMLPPTAQRDYHALIDNVVRDLETREAEIGDNLVAYAVEQGLGRNEAYAAIRDCGLQMTAPLTPVTTDPRIAEMEAQMEAMQQTLRELRGE